ncbi:insecticidal delta-endotoxin Cry8Ea1 family protein, partial [Bacillus cereus]|nr:insecticidal delta-endotoxin Cry8Ea1 family protein [Bacillus cereus]MEB9247634.1 insecticidal delta-endotoxin Cry8Ea1 family protein [Bacillus cereus]MEB9297166.1 insecticidal delta-endotoxin Cry8Ea1 family protein [Bacillus cereus]MEC0012798.1 insecticidal delta-endotoxin Cry8Ea1 family protein [Bacillus cereus]MEC2242859.1 insecticidal delta-endotoxin Cry8Ea1 family protein [Bacillus cereus]
MEINNQNQCVPYNCLNNPESEILNVAIFSSEQVAEIHLKITRLILENFLPGGSFAFGLFDLIWGIFNEDQWSAFLRQVEELINQRITEFARGQAIQRLVGFGRSYDEYILALKEWENDPDNPASKERVRTRFRTTDDALLTGVPLMAIPGFELATLSVYAQSANLHLALLRDAVFFGERWGLTQTNINDLYSRLKNSIRDYTNHCVRFYNIGLGNLNVIRPEYYRFQRELTISVLDLVALFPNYDIRTYPIPTKSQLTREIYTDPIISPGAQAGYTLQDVLREPHLMDFLNRLIIYTGEYRGIRHWAGHEVESSRTGMMTNIRFPLYGTAATAEPTRFITPSTFPGLNLFYRTLSAPIFRDEPGANIIIRYRTSLVEGVGFIQPNNGEQLYRVRGTLDSLDQLPLEGESSLTEYSHRLCHVRFAQSLRNAEPLDYARVPMFSWTHRSATPTNTIDPDVITQIPLVKAFNLHSGATVVRGPGFTGGDILRRTNAGNFGDMRVNITAPLSQRYRVRIRYASTANLQFHTSINGRAINQANFPATMNSGENLQSGSFRVAGFTTPFTFSDALSTFTIGAFSFSSNNEVYIDRIEFVPAEVTFATESDQDRAQKAVNALFTSSNQIGLKTDVTNYHIDQVSNLVECLSDEFCLDEKRELSEKVKHAKRLCDERNLLQDPNFRGINREPDRGWRGSTDITIQRGDDVFKENYVTLPGTFDECYPTYLYQKIDESKLKAYTRYELRGYIEDSQDLEIYLIRYNAKHETVNVPGTGSLWPLSAQSPIGKCGEPNRCATHLEWNPDLDCSCRDGEKCAHHSHHFSLDIDVGCTDLNEDLGVWVIFKIKTQDGHARLGNLEFLEEKPLLGEALARVKRAEKKWRDKREKLELETNIVYKEAKKSVDALFVNSQYDRLQADTNIAIIHAADKRVHSIREAYLPELSVIPGVNAAIFEELEGRIFTAYSLYDARNVIKNGDFNNGLSCWNVKGHVDVEEQNNHRSVLVVPEWEAEVSQEVRVCPGRGYILRVTAYKEGYGEGCVTIHEIEDNTDELKFSNCVEEEIYPNNTVTCNDYTATQEEYEGTYTSRNRGYDGAYESNSSVPADYASAYEEKAYTDGRRDNTCESNRGYGDYTPLPAGYVTKELEYFPETDKVWIEIGETEGTFIVDSVELLL